MAKPTAPRAIRLALLIGGGFRIGYGGAGLLRDTVAPRTWKRNGACSPGSSSSVQREEIARNAGHDMEIAPARGTLEQDALPQFLQAVGMGPVHAVGVDLGAEHGLVPADGLEAGRKARGLGQQGDVMAAGGDEEIDATLVRMVVLGDGHLAGLVDKRGERGGAGRAAPRSPGAGRCGGHAPGP